MLTSAQVSGPYPGGIGRQLVRVWCLNST